MSNIILKKQWNWKVSGIALGVAFLLAVLLVKPIGVSTQFVILDGIIWNALASEDVVMKDAEASHGYSSPNEYLNKSGGKYAKSVAKPLNYSFIFVIAMIAGGFLGRILTSKEEKNKIPDRWVTKCGNGSIIIRYIFVFIGGVLALIGARLAGGCTSGHMMSGMMQTSLSGYLFAVAAFAFAIPTAFMAYKNKEDK